MSGRIRTIKPEWLEDERMCSASPAARVLSIGLILLADDYGNGRAHPNYLAGQVFPGTLTASEVSAALAELEGWFACTYCANGQTYFSIRNWDKHQRVQHAGKPRVPGPSGESPETLTKVPESLTPDLRPRSPISDLRPEISDPPLDPPHPSTAAPSSDVDRPASPSPSKAQKTPQNLEIDLVAPSCPAKPLRRVKARSACPPAQSEATDAFLRRESLPSLASEDGGEVERFLNHHNAKGTLSANWRSSWATWRGNWAAYGRRTTGPASWLQVDRDPDKLPPLRIKPPPIDASRSPSVPMPASPEERERVLMDLLSGAHGNTTH